jgi:hypothetical protein
MRSGPNTVIAAGGAVALVLLIAAIWATGASLPTQLALTGVLILIAVGILAGAVPRGPGERLPQEADADQRERMRSRVP